MHTVSGNVSQVTGDQPMGKHDRKDKRHCVPLLLEAPTLKGISPLAF